MKTALKPKHLSVFDESDRKQADWDASEMFLDAANLCNRTDEFLPDGARDHMKRTAELLTARLRRMK